MAVFSGIAAAVGAVGTWFAGLGVFGQVAVRIVAGLAFNAISRALAGKPDKPRRPGITGQIQQGADLPRSFILGRYATPGSLVYHNTWGKAGKTPNAYYTRATALSDLPIAGLVAVWVDGERMVLGDTPDPDGLGYPLIGLAETRTNTVQVYDGDDSEGRPTYRYDDQETTRDYGWVRFHDGTQSAADPLLVSIGTDERPWSTDDAGYGVAYAVTTFKLNRRLFNRFPELIFEVDGVPLTAPDGSAAGASCNPIVQVWHLLKGLAWGGERLFGPATPAYLDATDWQAQADLCDQPVPGGADMSAAQREEAFGSATVPERYRAGLEVDVSRDVADVIEDVLTACNGRAAYTGAGYRVQVGDPQAAVATLTDADILSTQGQSFAPFLPLAETVNSVAGTYPDPEEAWQRQEAPPLIVSAYEDEERGRRLPTTVDLPAVPYREQVQRLMQAALAEARRARRHTVTLPARYWTLLPGDYLDWTSLRNGYDGKRFRVDGVVDLPNGDVQMDLTEVDPSDYDWSADTDYAPVARGSITGQPPGAASVSGFALAAVAIPDATGEGRRPAILLTWDDPESDDVEAVRWQVRLPGGAAVSAGRTPDVELRAHYIVEGILPAETYEVRARLDAPGRPTPWTPWTGVTAPDIRLTAADLATDLRDKIDDAFDRHDAALDSATGTVAALRDATTDALGGITRTIDIDLPDRADVSRGLDTTAEQLLWLQAEMRDRTSEMRDAGIYVDPDLGRARIEGVDRAEGKATQALVEVDAVKGEVAVRATTTYVDNQIAQAVIDPSQIPVFDQLEARISSVEITANSNEGAIALKADTTELNGLESRVTTAEADIDSLEGEIVLRVTQTDFDDLETRVSDAEVTIDTLDGANIGFLARDVREQNNALDASAIQSLEDLLTAYEDREALRTDVALAKQDLRALVDEDREAIASVSAEIGVRFGQAQALIEQEALTRASETEALAQTVSQLQSDLDGNSAAITDLSTTRVTADGAVAAVETEISATYNSLADLAAGAEGAESELDPNTPGTIAARVNTIEGAYVDADGARAAVETGISAQYGSLTALAMATQFAEATVSGIQSGFVWSLGGDDVLSLVQVQDGETAPTTTARIKGDYIRLDGTVEVAGDFLVGGGNIVLDADTTVTGDFSVQNANISGGIFSEDYVAGVSGWGIFKGGGAQFPATAILGQLSADSVQIDGVTLDTDGSGNLIVKTAGIGETQISVGAVSSKYHEFNKPFVNENDSNFFIVNSINENNHELARVGPITTVAGQTVRMDFGLNAEAPDGATAGEIHFERRVSSDGGETWGPWTLVRVTDTGPITTAFSTASGATPISHVSADLRSAAETREYRLTAKKRDSSNQRFRVFRVDFGIEQIKR